MSKDLKNAAQFFSFTPNSFFSSPLRIFGDLITIIFMRFSFQSFRKSMPAAIITADSVITSRALGMKKAASTPKPKALTAIPTVLDVSIMAVPPSERFYQQYIPPVRF